VTLGQDAAASALVEREFDSLTPDNALKWGVVHPKPGTYDFTLADKYVEFGCSRGMFLIGHTLMWHQQTPAWVFSNPDGSPRSREALLTELREHIRTVVGRYKGRVRGWDVVNEAVDDAGGLRLDKPWYRILGEEGIFAAFEAAHEADPDAELYYNDYSVWNAPKLKSVLELVARLRARGLRIDAVGLQEHYLMDSPSVEEVGETLAAFERIGMPVMITELDITVLPRPDNYDGAEISRIQERRDEYDPYRDGLPPEREQALAARYGAFFRLYREHAKGIRRITFWGVGDGFSWLNNWPIRGRRDYPLLFDRQLHPKPAHQAVLRALQD
jgi:endo-1,4-beta-xylanase